MLQDEIPWTLNDQSLRSWSFSIHSLGMIDLLLVAHSRTGDAKYLDLPLKVSLDWAKKHPRDAKDVDNMAWYDMAVGMRAYRLAYLTQAAEEAGLINDETREILYGALEAHRAELADDAKIIFQNNHGYYQIAGQLALGRRFGATSQPMQELYDQGLERFHRILDKQFSAEGVHREHSPNYHRMVLSALQGIVRSGLISDDTLRQRAHLIEESLAWFIFPSGRVVNFGDSDSHSVLCSAEAAAERWDTVLMRAVATEPPHDLSVPRGLKRFDDSGYAVVRIAAGDEGVPSQDSYLAQTACFHSRAHKHADDLSFVWFDRGEPLLVDAGRYGYLGMAEKGSEAWLDGSWYSDPMRLFVESTRAHNTLEFDTRSSPRLGAKPYGSGIVDSAEADGTFAIESACKQFGSIRHERVLVFRPAEWLITFDVFTDNLKQPHDVTQWFHAAPGSQVTQSAGGFEMETVLGQKLCVVALLPGTESTEVETGVREPRLQGWWSGTEREAEPAPAFGFRQTGSTTGVFATLFTFANAPEPDFEASRCNVTGRRFRLNWSDEAGDHSVSVHRDDGLKIIAAD